MQSLGIPTTTISSPSLSLPSKTPRRRLHLPPTPISCSSTQGPLVRKRTRYRRSYPGEANGITEEMRFVAMKLRGDGPNKGGGEEASWCPSIHGFLKYLVDSRLVFDALEGVVDRSDDVAFAYFRKTGLERSEGLSKDIEQIGQLGFDIPEPSSPGNSYASYLKEIAASSVPSFLSHFYNIYFGHVTGGQAIGKQVTEKLLGGRELEFYKWEGDALELLKDVRESLNKVGEHWTRDEKNRCLRETAKCFRMSGQIIRLIIL